MPKPKTSYKTIELEIPADLVEPIKGVTSTPGTWQRPFQRMAESLKQVNGQWVARVRDEDIETMKKLAEDPGEGSYERWADEILKANGISPFR